EKLFELFEKTGEKKIISKGDFLIKEGEIESSVYLIKKGAVRVFHLTEFEEQTVRFGYERSVINSLSSFIKGTPSEFYIEAIRKSTIEIITKTDFTALVYSNDQTIKEYIGFIETVIAHQIEREIDLLTVSPLERLERVLARSPNLFQEIPLKYIASYLRMTPETLSRVRNP
ncbi:MAG: Crp/Fnr family transcriptional regulator, partial [Ginsengibacter sp.]